MEKNQLKFLKNIKFDLQLNIFMEIIINYSDGQFKL
jgi:hypothetical protein